jgi:Lrp/AsnC family transcriptional regulator for asnA, asnC and gidA
MNSLNIKDLKILAHLRQDSRVNLTKISKKTLMPVTTIFDKMKKYQHDIIQKSTILVDFKKLGYDIRVQILVKVAQEKREDFRIFLQKSFSINSVYRINNGFDYMIEAIFKDMIELEIFNDQLDTQGITAKQEHYILEDIRKEEFISQPDLVDLVGKSTLMEIVD